jgi:hypothetical protein
MVICGGMLTWMVFVKSYGELLAARAMLGILEAGLFPGVNCTSPAGTNVMNLASAPPSFSRGLFNIGISSIGVIGFLILAVSKSAPLTMAWQTRPSSAACISLSSFLYEDSRGAPLTMHSTIPQFAQPDRLHREMRPMIYTQPRMVAFAKPEGNLLTWVVASAEKLDARTDMC